MYAVFETGGKQYKASVGDELNIEKMDVAPEEKLELKNVLMIVNGDDVKVGFPTIENAKIVCHVVDYIAGKKIYVFKSKRRKGYRRKIGHRQKYMRIYIDEIKDGSEKAEITETE